jgi:hypothetical protein
MFITRISLLDDDLRLPVEIVRMQQVVSLFAVGFAKVFLVELNYIRVLV